MTAETIDLKSIRKQELFSTLRDNEIFFVKSHCGIVNIPKKELLFSCGEKAAQFFILTSGIIRVFKKKEDGTEEETAYFSSGDTIGDFDFARGADYDAYAEAAEDSHLIAFPVKYGTNEPATMDSLSREDPNTVCSILLNSIIMMTTRIKSTRRLILENMPWIQELHRRAYEDPGTGLWKQTLIADEIAGTLNDPCALIMLKPDRFKILVDSRGHSAGDEAMIKIALILKNITRILGHGWAIRFKSNEAGLIINNCHTAQAKNIAHKLYEMITAMEPVPASNGIPAFSFSATVSWTIWPKDDPDWDSFLNGNYSLLLDTWKNGGQKIMHYSKTDIS